MTRYDDAREYNEQRSALARSLFDAQVPAGWDGHLKGGLRDMYLHFIRFGRREVLERAVANRFKPEFQASRVEWLERLARSVDAKYPRLEEKRNEQ